MNKGTILIVDDNADIIEQFARALKREGYIVDTAGSGKEGWVKYQNRYYDVVVVDQCMEKTNSGMELLQRIIKRHPFAAVIMITGYGSEEIASNAINSHVSGYLKKPIDIPDFLKKVKDVIERKTKIATAWYEYNLPFPIASTRSMIETHSIYHSRLTAIMDCAESIIKYCTSIVLANYLKLEPNEKVSLFQSFNRPKSFGAWKEKLGKILRKLKERRNEVFPIIPKIENFYFGKEGINEKILQNIIEKRNEVAHGGTQNESVYEKLYEDLMPKLDQVLSELEFTNEFPIVVVTGTEIIDNLIKYEIKKIMGSRINFPKSDLNCKNGLRLRKNTLYILDEKNQQELLLFPFLIFNNCELCGHEETFFLNKIQGKMFEYRTYRLNHLEYRLKLENIY
jgi:CheY-like chemotaxis protein